MALADTTVRRTQAERTAAMRARLLDATVECLVELGYAGTTTTEVARRAGVSRGAQLHHFPTKQLLVLAAIEHVQRLRQEEVRAAFAAMEPEQRTLSAAIDLLWAIYRGPTFSAWLELAVAARTDADLHEHFRAMGQRFTEQVAAIFIESFPTPPDPQFSALAVEFAFAALDGVGLQRHVGIGHHADKLIDMLKFLATTFAPRLGGTP